MQANLYSICFSTQQALLQLVSVHSQAFVLLLLLPFSINAVLGSQLMHVHWQFLYSELAQLGLLTFFIPFMARWLLANWTATVKFFLIFEVRLILEVIIGLAQMLDQLIL